MENRHPHILNASTNLLGICFVIITSLKLTGSNSKSWADEIAWIAAAFFLTSTVLSYLVIGDDGRALHRRAWSHRAFLAGIAALFVSVLVASAFI